jgi:hypothetical protein
MSRILRIGDSTYKVQVNDNGEIVLDTGDRVGYVRVTGNLVVEGITTTVESTAVSITDSIITVNNQVDNNGNLIGDGILASEGEAGIEIGRGTLTPARILFNESLYWRDPNDVAKQGAFIFKFGNTQLAGIRTNSITTGNKDLDLSLLAPSPAPNETGTGTAVISVRGVVNYANRINNKLFVQQDLDAYNNSIPNVAWVAGAIQDYFNATPPQFIRRGDDTTGSVLQIFDTTESDAETKLELKFDSIVNATFRVGSFTVQDFKISDGTIETLTLGNDLFLKAAGTGSVRIDDNLKITLAAEDPNYAAGTVRIYTKPEAYGGSGVYFVNNEETRDELVSRRKALAYSMIF